MQRGKIARYSGAAILVSLSILVALISGCGNLGHPSSQSNNDINPWDNLPVVGDNGNGTVDERGGIIKVARGVEFQVPKGALPAGTTAHVAITEEPFVPPSQMALRAQGFSFANSAWRIATDASIPIVFRLVLSKDKLSSVLPVEINDSYIVEAIQMIGSAADRTWHIMSRYAWDNKWKFLNVMGVTEKTIQVTLMAASRELVKRRCEDGGGEFFDSASPNWGFPLPGLDEPFVPGYVCRPPSGYIWDRKKLEMVSENTIWPFQGEPDIKLITANVGNFAAIPGGFYRAKLVSDVVAQRIANNLSVYDPDLVLLQELYRGSKQLAVLLDTSDFLTNAQITPAGTTNALPGSRKSSVPYLEASIPARSRERICRVKDPLIQIRMVMIFRSTIA